MDTIFPYSNWHYSCELALGEQEAGQTTALQELIGRFELVYLAGNSDHNLCFANANKELRAEFKTGFTPAELSDYIYALLHWPAFRAELWTIEKLKTIHIPLAKHVEGFWQLVQLGNDLRSLHTGQLAITDDNFTIEFNTEMTIRVEHLFFTANKIYFNSRQTISPVSQSIWELILGGELLLQKWLRAREGQNLDCQDLLALQQLIKVISATEKIMNRIGGIALD